MQKMKRTKGKSEFSLRLKIYTYLRLLMLPISDIHENLPKKGRILDLGCGSGGLCLTLSKFSTKRLIIGWDFDELKVNAAIKANSRSKNTSFKVKDIIASKFPRINGAIASDFLHHVSKNNQETVVKKIYLSLEKNGVLIIKETDKGDFIRHQLSKLWDKLFYPNDKTYYRSQKEWIRLLEAIGFSVLSKNCVLWFPGSTKLFICKKKL